MSARCAGTSGHWHGMQRKQEPAPREGRHLPPTCPLLAVAGDGTLLCHPLPAACPSWQRPGRCGFGRSPRESCPTVCRSGWEGYPLSATLQKKVPYASTKLLARGNDAVLGILHCPNFITKGCRIVVAMSIPLADAALAVRGRVSPSAPAQPHSPMLAWGGVGNRSRVGLTSPMVPTFPSAGTTTSSQRQRGD